MAILQFEGPRGVYQGAVCAAMRARYVASVLSDSAIRWTSLPGSHVLSEW